MNLFCNVFYDPSSPWYYVTGVIFLILIFGALALYVVLSKKYGKKPDEEGGSENVAANADGAPADSGENTQADEQTPSDSVFDKNEEK